MSDHCCSIQSPDEHNHALKKVLWFVFSINMAMFLVEITTGLIYHSTALMADSLDMLSDAFIYGVSIFVVAKSSYIKAKVSLLKGLLMALMALYVVYELIVRILNPIMPDGQIVSVVGALALVANAVSFWLLYRHKAGDINMRSSWICSRNDMVANIGVISAGMLVLFSGSHWPDYIIGAGIVVMVLLSSFKIVRDSVKEIKLSKK